jgi:hypothetical protein
MALHWDGHMASRYSPRGGVATNRPGPLRQVQCVFSGGPYTVLYQPAPPPLPE